MLFNSRIPAFLYPQGFYSCANPTEAVDSQSLPVAQRRWRTGEFQLHVLSVGYRPDLHYPRRAWPDLDLDLSVPNVGSLPRWEYWSATQH